MVVKVETVQRIDHDGHTRQPRGQLAQQPRLGIVGMDDGEALAAQHRNQPGQRPQIGPWREIARHRDGDVADPGGGQRGHIRPGSRDADDLIPGLLDRA